MWFKVGFLELHQIGVGLSCDIQSPGGPRRGHRHLGGDADEEGKVRVCTVQEEGVIRNKQ